MRQAAQMAAKTTAQKRTKETMKKNARTARNTTATPKTFAELQAAQDRHDRRARHYSGQYMTAEGFALLCFFGGLIFGLGLAGSPALAAVPLDRAENVLTCYLLAVFGITGAAVFIACRAARLQKWHEEQSREAFAACLAIQYPASRAEKNASADAFAALLEIGTATGTEDSNAAADAFAAAFGK